MGMVPLPLDGQGQMGEAEAKGSLEVPGKLQLRKKVEKSPQVRGLFEAPVAADGTWGFPPPPGQEGQCVGLDEEALQPLPGDRVRDLLPEQAFENG